MFRKEKIPRRNEKCPCGSGKKAKKCCLRKIEAYASIPPEVRRQIMVARLTEGTTVVQTPPVPAAVTEAFEAVK